MVHRIEIGTEAAQLLFWKYINRNFFVVQAGQMECTPESGNFHSACVLCAIYSTLDLICVQDVQRSVIGLYGMYNDLRLAPAAAPLAYNEECNCLAPGTCTLSLAIIRPAPAIRIIPWISLVNVNKLPYPDGTGCGPQLHHLETRDWLTGWNGIAGLRTIIKEYASCTRGRDQCDG